MPVPFAALSVSNRLIFDGETVCTAVVRCAPTAPDFHEPCISKCCSLAFSRSAVLIRPARRRSFVEDPTVVSFYNHGQEYSRRLLAHEGDRCEWLGISPAIVRDALRPFDPVAADADCDLFRASTAGIPSSVYLAQRALYRTACRERWIDSLWVEETALAILREAIRTLYLGAQRAETIKDGERDLGDLAVRLNFSHHSHFSAAFRRQFGVPPSHIRARLNGTTRRMRRLPART